MDQRRQTPECSFVENGCIFIFIQVIETWRPMGEPINYAITDAGNVWCVTGNTPLPKSMMSYKLDS